MYAARLILIVLACFLLWGCPRDVGSRATTSFVGVRAVSLKSFEEHVLPALQICSGCHGESQEPLFADKNSIEKSHDLALEKVNFNDIEASRLVVRVIKEAHNCGDCEATGDRLIRALTTWGNKRAAAGKDSYSFETNGLPLPQEDGGRRFDLGGLIGTEYRNTIFMNVSIEPQENSGHYKLTRLAINLQGDVGVYVEGIKPLINGRWDTKNPSYDGLACAVTPAERPGGYVIHNKTESIVISNPASTARLSFAFDELRIAEQDDPSCLTPELERETVADEFNNGAIGEIIKENCANCHTADNNANPDIFSSFEKVQSNRHSIAAALRGEEAMFSTSAQREQHQQRFSSIESDEYDDPVEALLNWLDKLAWLE